MDDSLIGHLQSFSVREEAVRLGGPDTGFRADYDSFLLNRVVPGIVHQKGAEPVDLATLGRVIKILELVSLHQSTSSAEYQSRHAALDLLCTLTLSFEPGPAALARHIGVCSVLWDAIESDAELNSVMAAKAFVHLYKAGHIVVMDADLSTRLHRFVHWMRTACIQPAFKLIEEDKRVSVLKEVPAMMHAIVQVFSGAAESYLSALIGDLISLFHIPDTVGTKAAVLVDIQVRALTMIAQLGRTPNRSEFLRSFDSQIAKSCVKLLRSVPSGTHARRELLLNVRSCFHCPDLVVAFVPLIDDLFDESVTVGIGRSSYDLLRPTVVSALADFSNAVKDKIPPDRLKRVLGFFCGALADGDLPVSAQFTSARIVLNLIDHVFNKSASRNARKTITGQPGAPDGSDVLREVLRAVTEKFTALVLFVPKVIELVSESLEVPLPDTAPRLEPDQTETLIRLVGKGAPAGVPLADMLIEGVREVRSLIRTLLLCAKMIVHCLTHRVSSRVLSKADLGLLESLLEDGLKVVHLFACAAGFVQSAGFDDTHGHSSANGGGRFATPLELAVACSIQEERELIEQIAGVLSVVPSVSLTDLVAKKINWLVDAIQANSQLMALCNGLVQTPSSMGVLCEVLYGFLAVRGEELLIGKDEPLSHRHRARFAIVDPDLEEVGVESYNGVPVAAKGLARLHPSSFELTHTGSLLENNWSLLGPSRTLSYFVGDGEAVDGPLLVSHVMPSLDPKLRTYRDVVTAYGLRDSPVKIDLRDVLVTIGKTLARQTAAVGGNPLEPVVRPFVAQVSVACIRVAKAFPHSASHCAGILRYMYRLMGSGIKTIGSSRELGEIVSFIVDQCRALARHWNHNSVLHALFLEAAITVPVRLKSVVAHFEQLMAVLIDSLCVDAQVASETIAVGLNVLESWVDGLTPDFLLPLIPGHGTHGLVEVLVGLTRPPNGLTVHTSQSGANSVRAVRILGKLGIKARFNRNSYNVVGEKHDVDTSLSTIELLHVGSDCLVEVDLGSALSASLKLLRTHAAVIEKEVPVSLQDPPGDVNEIILVPDQELLDSLNLVVTCLNKHRGNEGVLKKLCAGLIHAAGSQSSIVSSKAGVIIADLGFDEENVDFPLIVQSAIAELDGSARVKEVCMRIVTSYVDSVSLGRGGHATPCLLNLMRYLAEHLLVNTAGACSGLEAVLVTEKALLLLNELGGVVIERAVLAYSEAEGTRTRVPCIVSQRSLVEVVEKILRTILNGVGVCPQGPQETQQQWLSCNKQIGLKTIKPILVCCLELFVTAKLATMAESVLVLASNLIGVSMAALISWADPDLLILRKGITGESNGSVFRITSFLLAMRPGPILTSVSASDALHKALLLSIQKAVDWLEREDELHIIYDPASSVSQQVFLLHRAVLKRELLTSADIEGQYMKWIDGIRLIKLALGHPQLSLGDQVEPMLNVLSKLLFSSDYEIASAAQYVLGPYAWTAGFTQLAREVASRPPSGVCEIQGLGRLLQLGPPEEVRAELCEKLLERLHVYVSALRERSFHPCGGVSWRCLQGPDAIVALAAVTLECFGHLQSERSQVVERLLVLVSQLDLALPSTFQAGQICSPFVLPLVPALCIDPERTADQLLTKMELHKVFGLVAELVSLRACLGLRKALQDKCHQMSLMDTGILMMRTAAASLVSVLARHDPSYLWIQYCSVVMKASMGLPRSLSLMESLVRNWETSLSGLTAGLKAPGSTVSLGPGGILGPSDISNSVNSYEGRIVGWSVMQFLRAPVLTSPGIVTDIDSHLNIRVRLLIRLATSLSFKYLIEVSPIQDWFVSEAPRITTNLEKREIVAKIIEAFADNAVGLGCKYVLLRYLLIPQIVNWEPILEKGDIDLLTRLVHCLTNISVSSCDQDEAVRTETVRLILVVLNKKITINCEEYLHAGLLSSGVAGKQIAALGLVETNAVSLSLIREFFDPLHSELWRDVLIKTGYVIAGQKGQSVMNDPQTVHVISSIMGNSSGNDVHIFRWFLSIAGGLSDIKAKTAICESLCHLFKKSAIAASTTESRMLVLDLALWTVQALPCLSLEKASLLGNFFLRQAANGPEYTGNGSSVSPTLWAEYMEKCLIGMEKVAPLMDGCDLKLIEPLIAKLPSGGDILRHCKHLVGIGRIIERFVQSSTFGNLSMETSSLINYIGVAMVSTDKSVCAVLALLVTGLINKKFVPPIIMGRTNVSDLLTDPSICPIWKQIISGIYSGLCVAANNVGSAKYRLQNGQYLVTPYTAVAVLIAVLRGMDKKQGTEFLSLFRPLLLEAVVQGSKSLVFGLLPIELHAWARRLLVKDYNSTGNTGNGPLAPFAYQGVLQGPEFAVPSLLEIVRLGHISHDLMNGGDKFVFRSTIVWIVETIGPFVSLSNPSHQTFAQVVSGVNLGSKTSTIGLLSSSVSVIQLSALLRHCIGIAGRWCLGPSYTVTDDKESDWLLDDVVRDDKKLLVEKSTNKLVLSLTSSLVGQQAIESCCNVTPIANWCIKLCEDFSQETVSLLFRIQKALDGVSALVFHNDVLVKVVGFVPSRSVMAFPGTVISEITTGGLASIANELVRQVMDHLSISSQLLDPLLIMCLCHDRIIREYSLGIFGEIVPKKLTDRLIFLLSSCPWKVLTGRSYISLFVEGLLCNSDDRVFSGDDSSEFSWIHSVITISRMDKRVAYDLFVSIFDQMINHIDTNDRAIVLSHVITLLSSPAMARQSMFEHNIVSAILLSCNCALPPSLLVHCAFNYGTYIESLNILERMHAIEKSEDLEVSAAIRTVLKALGEKDTLFGFIGNETGMLLAHNKPVEARQILENVTEMDPGVRETLYMEAVRELSDWSRLGNEDLGTIPIDPLSQMEIFLKAGDYSQLAELISHHDWTHVSDMQARAKIASGYLSLSSGLGGDNQPRMFMQDMETNINRSFHQLVSEWSMFPLDSEKSITDLLLVAQELVELSEGAILVTDVRAATMGTRSTYPNPKQLLNAWRDRLPDKSDGSDRWFELLSLRAITFRQVQQLCAVDVVAHSHISPFLHDYPWTLVKLSCTVKDKGLSQSLLTKFQQSLSRSTDAFNQELFEGLKQQISLYALGGSDTEITTALNVLNSCALSNSNSQQAAEISWLRGRLMRRLNKIEEAKTALMYAVNTYPMIAKAWIDLGDLLYEQDNKEECLMAYMMGLSLRPSRSSRLVPRMLLLAEQEGCKSLGEKCKDSQPSSVWIFWVPLLVNLLNTETAKAVLGKISLTFPQSVYWYTCMDGMESISEHMRSVKTSPLFADLDNCRDGLMDLWKQFVEPSTLVIQASHALNDLRFRHISVAELRLKYPLVKTDMMTETGLIKLIKTERGKLDKKHREEQQGLFLNNPRWNMTGLVEMPGNYTRFMSVPCGSSMESMSGIRISHVLSEFETVMLDTVSQVVVPRVTFVGTNGLRYAYTISSSSVDSSMGMQTSALCNELMGKYASSKQRGLKINCLQSVPVSVDVAIHESPSKISSWERVLVEASGDVDAVDMSVAEFKKVLDSINARNPDRVAFDQFSVSPNLLAMHVQARSPNDMFAISKRFAYSLATISMVDHALGTSAAERGLDQWFLSKDGTVFVRGDSVRVGKGSHDHVPFRLTKNVVALVGERNMKGILPISLRAVADCLDKKREGLTDFVTLTESKKASDRFADRISEIVNAPGGIHAKVDALVAESMDPKNLSHVQPRQWLPWF